MIAFVDAFLASFFIAAAVLYSAKQKALHDRDGDDRTHHGAFLSEEWWGRAAFDGFRAAIFLVVTLRLIFPAIDFWLVPLDALWVSEIARGLGAALMVVGLWRIFYAHSYMGESWRSGVSDAANDPLVTSGPYARSRNPIFMGVIMAQAGFFLALPSLFAAICLVIGAAAIVNQSRVEERRLAARFGGEFAAYRAATPAWRL